MTISIESLQKPIIDLEGPKKDHPRTLALSTNKLDMVVDVPDGLLRDSRNKTQFCLFDVSTLNRENHLFSSPVFLFTGPPLLALAWAIYAQPVVHCVCQKCHPNLPERWFSSSCRRRRRSNLVFNSTLARTERVNWWWSIAGEGINVFCRLLILLSVGDRWEKDTTGHPGRRVLEHSKANKEVGFWEIARQWMTEDEEELLLDYKLTAAATRPSPWGN